MMLAALVGGLAGCGSGKAKTVTVTSTAPGPTVTVTVTATPTPSATPTVAGTVDKPLALGKTWTSPDVSATVYAFNADAAPSAPPPQDSNRKWEAIDVKVCPTIAGTISNHPWSLIGNDNGSYDPSSTGYSQFPQPQYPFGDHAVSAGECVRGWIVFDVLRSVAITKIRYSVEDASGAPTITYWKP